jgi:cobalt/nickel transport system permease protein
VLPAEPGVQVGRLLATLLAIAVISSEPLGRLLPYAAYVLLLLLTARVWRAALPRDLVRTLRLLPLLILLGAGLPASRALDVWFVAEAGLGSRAAVTFLASPAPWLDGASLFLRASCALFLLQTLVLSIGWHGVLAGLRALRLPAAIPMVLDQLERYRELIAEEWRRTTFARESRSPGDMRFALASYAGQTGLVFLRSWERSQRIHAAMLARGFTLESSGQVTPAGLPGRRFSRHAPLLLAPILKAFWLPALALLVRIAL